MKYTPLKLSSSVVCTLKLPANEFELGYTNKQFMPEVSCLLVLSYELNAPVHELLSESQEHDDTNVSSAVS